MRRVSGEDAHGAELRAGAPAAARPAGVPSSSSSAATSACFEAARPRASGSFWAPPARLGDDPVDHAELEAVERVGLERRGRLLRLARGRARGSARSPRA